MAVLAALLVIIALTLFYTFEGGLTAVIWTDVIQLLIYLTGTAVALALALHAIPGGWTEVSRLAHSEGNKLAVFNFHFNWHEPYLFWSGLVGGAFLNTASHGTDQLIVQRLLAARNRRQSQAALLSSGLLILLQFTLFLLVGVVLFAFYKHFPPPEPFRAGGPDISHLRGDATASRAGGLVDRGHYRCRHGQSKRRLQLPGVEFSGGFLQAVCSAERRREALPCCLPRR